MKQWSSDILAIFGITTAVIIFFFRLFAPIPQIVATQDLGRSDAWHFSFATKFELGKALHEGKLLTWKSTIGDGFPLLAEGQTGIFYLPNTIFFSIFDAVWAYNLIIVLAFSMIGVGMYCFVRIIGFSPLAAFFAGITLTFFAYPMLQLPHITLLQATSIMPFLLATTVRITQKGWFPWGYIFAFLLTQQIFSGFPQATFLTLVTSLAFILWHAVTTHTYKNILYIITATALGMGMALAQLVPSWEFLKASAFPRGFTYQSATQYSFASMDLETLINPFAIANNKYAIFPEKFLLAGNIPWENTIYMGIFPLVLLLFALLTTRKVLYVKFFAIVAGASLLLAGGRHSPLYLIYTLWPLTLFRVPSRFIWLFSFFLIVIAASAVDWLDRRSNARHKIIILVIILVHAIQLMHTWWSYQLFVPAHEWIQPPEIINHLQSGRVFTIGEEKVQQELFATKGWVDPKPYFELRNGVAPLSNMLWDIPQHGIYAGRFLLRPTVIDQLLNMQEISIKSGHATMSATAHSLLNMLSVTNIISFFPLTHLGLTHTYSQTNHGITLELYHNTNALPRARFVSQVVTADTVERVGALFQESTFDPKKTVILENHEFIKNPHLSTFLTPSIQNPLASSSATISIDQDTKVEITTSNAIDAMLVLADTSYPGWIAKIDGEPTHIFTANFTQRAVFVPQGTHTVTFTYEPESITYGIWGTLGFTLLTTALMVFQIFSARHRTEKKVPPPAKRRVNNHGK